MKKFSEAETAKSYEGKTYNTDSLRRIAMGYGESSAIVYYGRLSKPLFDLFGITESLLDTWLHNGINYSVVIDLDEASSTIKWCGIAKTDKNNRLSPTQQEIEIFQKIMDYITRVNK